MLQTAREQQLRVAQVVEAKKSEQHQKQHLKSTKIKSTPKPKSQKTPQKAEKPPKIKPTSQDSLLTKRAIKKPLARQVAAINNLQKLPEIVTKPDLLESVKTLDSPIVTIKPETLEHVEQIESPLETILPDMSETDVVTEVIEDQPRLLEVDAIDERPNVLVELPMPQDYDSYQPKANVVIQPQEAHPELKLPSLALAEQIETLEPIAAQEATGILVVVQEKIEQLQELVNIAGDAQEQNAQALEQELEILCTRLLVCMEQESTPEAVEQLIRNLKIEFQEQAVIVDQEANVDGMHERKLSVFQLLTSLVGVVQPPDQIIGKYALQLAVA